MTFKIAAEKYWRTVPEAWWNKTTVQFVQTPLVCLWQNGHKEESCAVIASRLEEKGRGEKVVSASHSLCEKGAPHLWISSILELFVSLRFPQRSELQRQFAISQSNGQIYLASASESTDCGGAVKMDWFKPQTFCCHNFTVHWHYLCEWNTVKTSSCTTVTNWS